MIRQQPTSYLSDSSCMASSSSDITDGAGRLRAVGAANATNTERMVQGPDPQSMCSLTGSVGHIAVLVRV